MSRISTAVELPYRHDAVASEDQPGFDELMGLLSYNQGLVEFADSKASSLILLNSLLIAAVTALPNGGQMGLLKMASVLVASAAVFLCFQVITSQAGAPDDAFSALKRRPGWQANDFIFFGAIGAHKNGDEYVRAFARSQPEARRGALLQRTYIIAAIARRKFSQYALAQKATTTAMAVWVAVNLLPFLG
jgi:hypothetical protein